MTGVMVAHQLRYKKECDLEYRRRHVLLTLFPARNATYESAQANPFFIHFASDK